jgi:hypothetical protein
MKIERWLRGGLVAALMFGCVAEPEGAGDAAVELDRGAGLRLDMGGGGAGGAGAEGGMGGEGGQGAEGGQGGMAGEGGSGGAEADLGVDAEVRPDMQVELEIESCQQACDRYADCEQLASSFGDEEACLAQCERISRTGPPEQWWSCVREESCNLLRRCPIPRVEALSCDEVCERFDTCELDLPIGECQAACEASDAPFRACGEAIFGACDVDGFRTCLVNDVYPSCGAQCDAAVRCNIMDRDVCEGQCLSRSVADDPLTELRSAQLRQCLAGAGEDCLRVHECFNPPGLNPAAVNEVQFCAAFDACGLGQQLTCNQLWSRFDATSAQCAFDSMQRACPFNEFDLLEECDQGGGVDPRQQACTRFCEAMDVCDRQEGSRLDCINTCSGNQAVDPDEAERNDAQLTCGPEWSCDALGTCLAGVGPGGECAALCNSLTGCDLADEGCLEGCDAQWPRDRHAAYRACVAAAGDDCAAVGACAIAPQVPCDRFCQTLTDCGQNVGATCANECDDLHFSNPLDVTLTVACALSAGGCEAPPPARSVQACLEDPAALGSGCYNYCRATTECNPDNDDALVGCLTTCVEGFGNALGLTYAAAAECLEGAAPDAACEVVVGCLPEAVPAVDCDVFCAQVDACDIPNEDCLATCAAAPDADIAGCAYDALRVGQQCGGVATCVGYVPPAADATCAELCAERRECEGDLDPYLCERACTPTPPEAAVQLACAQAAVCAELPGCLALGADANPACAEPCQAAVECGAFPDLASCNALCTGRDASPRTPETFIAGLADCLAAAAEGDACNAEAARDCFEAPLCEWTDDIVVLPANGGLVEGINTAGRGTVGRAQCGGGGDQVVVAITINAAANVTFETVNNQNDTLIHLRSVCDDAATEIACNDDGGAGGASRISQLLQPGTYFLYVDGFGGRPVVTDLRVTVQ